MKSDNKTRIYSDNSGTSVYKDKKNVPASRPGTLIPGETFICSQVEYKLVEIISDSTAEAVIYKIKDKSGKHYALKLYFEIDDPEQEPNPEALTRIKKIEDADILKLYDFGTGIHKYQEKHCYEISDFADGGDLLHVPDLKKKYTEEFLTREVIPQIFKGIVRLHGNRIYHCDLKPQNAFYLDAGQQDLVIGDYGSSKTFEFDAARGSRKTTTVKGTDFYLPPEQARGFISEKNDYYSFGMILLHLFYPEYVVADEKDPRSLSHEKLKRIIERQFESKPIIDYNPAYPEINQLIEGLTLVDFNRRWGNDQVLQWINGEQVSVAYGERETAVKIKPLVIKGQVISSKYDLREFILRNDDWYVLLLEDHEGVFKDWLLGLWGGDRSRRSAFNRLVKHYSQDGLEYLSEAIIRFLIPEHPIRIDQEVFEFSSSSDVKKLTALFFTYIIFNRWEKATDQEIRYWIFEYEFALRALPEEESKQIINILYNTLKIDRAGKTDMGEFVQAYTKTDKTSLPSVYEFLADFLDPELHLELIELDSENNLSFEITKSINSYLQGLNINYTIPPIKVKKGNLLLVFPDEYLSHDEFSDLVFPDFYNQLIKNFPEIGENNAGFSMHAKSVFQTFFVDFIDRLKVEISKFKNEAADYIDNSPEMKNELNEMVDYIDKINVVRIQQVERKLQPFIDEIENKSEVQQLIDRCKKLIKPESLALPFLQRAENLVSIGKYEKAIKALNKKYNFQTEKTYNRSKIKKKQTGETITFSNFGAYTIPVGITAFSFSPNNYHVACSGTNPESAISVFSYESNKIIFTFPPCDFPGNCITFSPDGRYLAHSDIQGTVLVYDYESRKLIQTLENSYFGQNFPVYNILFSPDGQLILLSGAGGSSIYETISGELYQLLAIPHPVVLLPNDKIAAQKENRLLIMDIKKAEYIFISDTHPSYISKIIFSPDGKIAATCCEDNRTIWLWDVENRKLLHTLKGEKRDNGDLVCFSPDGKLLANISDVNNVIFWEVKTGNIYSTESIITVTKSNPIKGLAFHPQRNYVGVYTENSLIFQGLDFIEFNIVTMDVLSYIEYENKLIDKKQEFGDDF